MENCHRIATIQIESPIRLVSCQKNSKFSNYCPGGALRRNKEVTFTCKERNMTENKVELNTNQQKAVDWNNGALLVLSGPGSGKTKVLTQRVARLICETPGRYWNVLALTYTNKAASEMSERVNRQVINFEDRAKMTTFHSFSSALLSLHGSHIGLKPNFTIITDKSDRISLLKNALEKVEGRMDYSGERLLSVIDRYIESVCDSEVGRTLSLGLGIDFEVFDKVYKNYRDAMIDRNMLDFPSLIVEALRLIRNIRGIRKQMHRTYKYICVDEFQDTNFSQYQMLCELVDRESNNLFVVADDDQVIYQWNGASPRRIVQLQKEFDMEVMSLPENYRCPASVVTLANRLISNNTTNFPEKKKIKAFKPGGSQINDVKILKFSKFEDEVKWVAQSIANRPLEERTACAVLARNKKTLEVVCEEFRKHSLVGYMGTQKREFTSIPLIWLHSVLRLANSRANIEHLIKVCDSFCEMSGIEINPDNIIALGEASEGDFLREWAKYLLKLELPLIEKEFIEKAVLGLLADHLNHKEFQTLAFEWIETRLTSEFDDCRLREEYEEEKQTWQRLVKGVYEQFEVNEVSLHKLLRTMDLSSKAPQIPKGAIPCQTIHSSKGMEFDHVYLLGMVEDQLPSWISIKKGSDSLEMEEERRNCFVAITRTQESLHLTYSDEVNKWKKTPSRFLSEMGILTDAICPVDRNVVLDDREVIVIEASEDYRIAS